MACVHAPSPTPAQIIEGLGGIRAASRTAKIGLDTVYRLAAGEGTFASYRKLAHAAGFRVLITEGKSEKWKALHSSQDMCWQTPPEIWRSVLNRLGLEQFDLDPCSPSGISTQPIPCADRYTVDDDGLARSWGAPGDVVWVNPPYGRALSDWIDKMIAEASRGVTVIALVPARTGTRWWHRAIDGGGKPEFLRGRLRFLGKDGMPGDAAPFDSALIWFM
ncbi:hypothetical protein HF289_03265 [Acidithiobacillus ferrooxidans]|nr:hypothetical protein [Acidithiobacillus ferrooxidans]